MKKKRAIIIGAGPAGLTAAYELLEKTDVIPVVYEMTEEIGGISKTVNYKGNRIDIGGHRFFSKSDRVMEWWQKMMPLQGELAIDDRELGREVPLVEGGVDPEKTDEVMLIRGRLSRIFFLRKFFDYPLSLSFATFKNLGLVRILKMGVTYVWARVFPIKKEKNLRDFLMNRFGGELYRTFFKNYTHKVWGVPCEEIKPEWGAQRIKGLSMRKAIMHALKKPFLKQDVAQKGVETSLIGQFTYPKLGPGQMWETVVEKIREKGGEVHLGRKLVGLSADKKGVTTVDIEEMKSGVQTRETADYFFSTMPIKELIGSFQTEVPENVREVARGLCYRDFITVGLLLDTLKIKNESKYPSVNGVVPDNWIYIQEDDVKIGRLQIFNNWSPYMVKDRNTVWLGLEYFCNEGDELWLMEDGKFLEFAKKELEEIGIIDATDVKDGVVLKVPKAYPAYFGTYDRLDEVKKFVNGLENLFLIGRNGMHRYNNQDHSMLSAMRSVENIVEGVTLKDNIWETNVEQEYHEER